MGSVLIGALEVAAKYVLPPAVVRVLDEILPREEERAEIEEIRVITQLIQENNEMLRSLIAFYAPAAEKLHSVEAEA